MKTKTCKLCQEEKPQTKEFFSPERTKNGFSARCRECVNRVIRERLREKRAKIPKKDTVKKDLLNKKIGKLTPVSHYSRKVNGRQRTYWHCLCECGETVDVVRDSLINQTTKSCGCIKRGKKGPNNHYWSGHGLISGTLFGKAKASATKRGMSFDVTIEEINDLFYRQDGKCALTGLDLKIKSSNKRSGQTSITASLDRIDSCLGYTIDNVQWVHKDINMMKNKFDEDYFIEMCSLVSKNERRIND
jgi:hypothetical protein